MTNSWHLPALGEIWSRAQAYFSGPGVIWALALQSAFIVGVIFLAFKATRGLGAWFSRLHDHYQVLPQVQDELRHLKVFRRVVRSFLVFVLIWVAYGIAGHLHWSRDLLFTGGIIALALTLVRLFTETMTNRLWAGITAALIWLWAALYICRLIERWQALLNNITFNFGQVHVTLLHISRALPFFLVLYWLSKNLSIIWRLWLRTGSGLTPAVQILLSRLGGIFLFSASGALVLHYLGLDLTVFAMFSGALGLGLGFGLQKVFANLVSGFILLADKSIKPGDVIQMGDKYGWINFLGSRYISVITRSGAEHLIPNENLITNEVVNWSYTQKLIRLQVPVGVAYDANLEQARDLMLEAAEDTTRVLKDPKPSCYLMNFGDNAITLELRVWINDPQSGISSVKSSLLWGIWQRFRDHGINLPYPQRDVHLKSLPDITFTPGPKDPKDK
jgi:small-conductance mechanosensitive channel